MPRERRAGLQFLLGPGAGFEDPCGASRGCAEVAPGLVSRDPLLSKVSAATFRVLFLQRCTLLAHSLPRLPLRSAGPRELHPRSAAGKLDTSLREGLMVAGGTHRCGALFENQALSCSLLRWPVLACHRVSRVGPSAHLSGRSPTGSGREGLASIGLQAGQAPVRMDTSPPHTHTYSTHTTHTHMRPRGQGPRAALPPALQTPLHPMSGWGPGCSPSRGRQGPQAHAHTHSTCRPGANHTHIPPSRTCRGYKEGDWSEAG